MTNAYKRIQGIGQIALDSRSAIRPNRRPGGEKPVYGVLQDLWIASVSSKAFSHVSLAHVHSTGIRTTVPDNVHAFKSMKVWVSQVQAEQGTPDVPLTLVPVQRYLRFLRHGHWHDRSASLSPRSPPHRARSARHHTRTVSPRTPPGAMIRLPQPARRSLCTAKAQARETTLAAALQPTGRGTPHRSTRESASTCALLRPNPSSLLRAARRTRAPRGRRRASESTSADSGPRRRRAARSRRTARTR